MPEYYIGVVEIWFN